MVHQTSKSPKRRRNAGFTLIEILVVITLIGLIAGLVAPKIMQQFDEGKIKLTGSKISVLRDVLDRYRMHHNAYPDTLNVLLEPSDKNLGDSYLDDPAKLRDAWDQDFTYVKSSSRKYEIISFGADGLEGGEGADADITSDKSKMVGN
jgi:general secretion pathway protein G